MKLSPLALALFITAFSSTLAFGQIKTSDWSFFEPLDAPAGLERGIQANIAYTSKVDINILREQLSKTSTKNQAQEVIQIPMPDGKTRSFLVQRNQLMPSALTSKYPQIMAFTGYALDRPSDKIFMDVTPKGMHAMIKGAAQTIYVDPYFANDDLYYSSYYKKDFQRSDEEEWSCSFDESSDDNKVAIERKKNTDYDLTFERREKMPLVTRIYETAITTTPEYTAFFGGTVADGLAAVVTALNRVSGIYETEMGVQLTLIPENDQLIFTDPNTAPIRNATAGLGLNQNVIDNIIGPDNYDLGHVFVTTNGGVASLGVVCSGGKARGLTGLPNPTGDPFYVDYVAHEMGHQFDGLHTFNGDSNACSGGNRSAIAAYEPGSGSTIQAYAGICSNDNLQNNSDAYFHLFSLMEITNHINGSAATCAEEINEGNNAPIADANAFNIDGKTIPTSTPFEISGQGSDPDGDNITYQWDQWDLGPQQDVNAGDNGSSPLFRSFFAGPSPVRIFPRRSDLLNNTTVVGETLPTTERTLNFQLTVRDNKGGWNNEQITLNVDDTAGPFVMTNLNSSQTISGNTTITWDVANTDNAAVDCQAVNILLSLNGGISYPILLAANVPNNGSAVVAIPDIFNGAARIKIKCGNNVFFDINNEDLQIVPGSTPCNITTVLDDVPIADGLYSSATQLVSSGVIPANGIVTFTGGLSLGLTNDFTIQQQAALEMYIFNCDE